MFVVVVVFVVVCCHFSVLRTPLRDAHFTNTVSPLRETSPVARDMLLSV